MAQPVHGDGDLACRRARGEGRGDLGRARDRLALAGGPLPVEEQLGRRARACASSLRECRRGRARKGGKHMGEVLIEVVAVPSGELGGPGFPGKAKFEQYADVVAESISSVAER